MRQRFLVNPLTIVTGYSHSFDATVRQGNYLPSAERFAYLPELGSNSFSKERGNEKTCSTNTVDFSDLRNSVGGYAEGRRRAARPGGRGSEGCKSGKSESGGSSGSKVCRRAGRVAADLAITTGAVAVVEG